MQSFRLLNPKGHILGTKQGLKGVLAPHFGLYHRFEISSPLIGRKFGSKDYQFNTYFCIDEPSFAAIGINMIYWVEYQSKIGRNCIWSILTTQFFNQSEAWEIEISGRATNEDSFESVFFDRLERVARCQKGQWAHGGLFGASEVWVVTSRSTNFHINHKNPHSSPKSLPPQIFCPTLPIQIFILWYNMVSRAYFKTKFDNAEARRDPQTRFICEKCEKNTVFEKINFFLQNCFSLIFFSDHPEDHPDLLKN